MAIPIVMPKVGISVESCVLTKWHKKKGDPVKKGDLLFTYETDKSTVDEEAAAEGVLLDIFFPEGADIPVLTNVCVIGNAGESADAFKAAAPVAPAVQPAAPVSVVSATVAPAQTAAPAQAADGFIRISPRARSLAQKTGADVARAVPTGAEGRVVERDIAALAVAFTPAAPKIYGAEGTGLGGRVRAADAGKIFTKAPSGPEYTDEKLSNVRKVIAKAMHESLSSMAQLTLNASFDAANILAFRASVKANAQKYNLPNITLNDIVLYAVSRTLLAHKNLNAHFLSDSTRVFNAVHLGMAVDTERGLLVPTIANADSKSLIDLAKDAKALAEQAGKGSIAPDKLKGGTFTVSNLGSFGVESFTPVINPPQVAILGVCGLSEKVKVENGQIKAYQSMGLSLTIDHRAVDGAPGARFLKDLCGNLENFSLLLL
ncbi:dihydrolipoamide acetyltransferase component of pyruvate dehydrogenase complex [Clostridia bacterium]|nr:dihydrolipoamide acetyltransferase component of pyruvate dehydrogenase complex [Clostridia bacterium]